MKGLAIDTIGFIIIALVGVSLLIMFISGSLTDLTKNVFCYFYQNILSRSSDICKQETIPEEIELRPESVEDLSRHLAAYSILCWEDATKSLKIKDTNCYSIRINTHPGNVSEFNVTYILETEGGCNKLENSKIINESGIEIDYPGDCGLNDELSWDIDGNVIYDQKLILIKYDDYDKKIIVKG